MPTPRRFRRMRGFEPVDPVAEATVRGALGTILWAVPPVLLGTALIASWIDHPGATFAALCSLLAAIALAGLAVRCWLRPPRHAHRAAALGIAILQLALVCQLLAIPDPVLATLQVILAVGTASFLIDLRWVLSMQAFGIACWLAATGLPEPTPQWQIARFVTLAGYGAAAAFYIGRVSSINRIRSFARENQACDEAARKSARALRTSEARLNDAQRIAHVGSFEWEVEADELSWSDENYRIFGWEPGEVRIDNAVFFGMVHADDRDAFLKAVADSLRDDTPVELEYRVLRADGEERVLLGRSETTRDESGKPIRLTGTSFDITDRHRVEAALRNDKVRREALLTAMDAQRVVQVSRDGIVRSIMGQLPIRPGHYGIGVEGAVGRSISEFLPGEAGVRAIAAIEDVSATGQGAEIEIPVELPGGSFDFDVSLRPLKSGLGGVESVLAIVRDVTQRKADALAVQQAQRLESLGILAGGIAHDFNNLLVGVLCNAEIVLEKLDTSSPLRPEIEDIFQAGTRAAELTRDLLAYAGKAEFETEPVDLAALVEECAQLVGPAGADGVTIEFDSNPGSIWVRADATQIRQVIMNFIENARDAVRGGCDRVRVRTAAMNMDQQALERFAIRDAAEPGEYCLVEVSDRGVGMDQQTLERIFDPFFSTKFQGRGLGLAATLGIVRAHGGCMHVESEPGRGSTFTILFPCTTPPTPVTPSEPKSKLHPRTGTILVVDDEDLVRSAFCRMLASWGYRVLDADCGSCAVEILESENSVGLALVDLTMPGMDGEQTFEALRAIDPELPVIFMSGHSSEDIKRRVAGKERSAYITKPFRANALSETIALLLADADATGKS